MWIKARGTQSREGMNIGCRCSVDVLHRRRRRRRQAVGVGVEVEGYRGSRRVMEGWSSGQEAMQMQGRHDGLGCPPQSVQWEVPTDGTGGTFPIGADINHKETKLGR